MTWDSMYVEKLEAEIAQQKECIALMTAALEKACVKRDEISDMAIEAAALVADEKKEHYSTEDILLSKAIAAEIRKLKTEAF